MKKALLIILAGLFILVLGCGGGGDGPPPPSGVTQADLEQAISKAVAEASAGQITQKDVQAAVAEALAPTPRPLEKLKLGTVQSSVFVLAYWLAKDDGVFEKWGFDVELTARPFPAFLAAFATREVDVSTYSGTTTIRKIADEGLPWIIIGGGLTVMQNVYVPVDSDIQTVEDLRGKKLGVWSKTSGALEALRAILKHEYDFDVFDGDQVELVIAAAPALFALAEKGEVDAMFQLSSLTIRAASQPDVWREVFSPNKYWLEKTGQPLMWSAPIVAWSDWVTEDPDRAKRLVAAYTEAFVRLKDPDNLQRAVDKYGELAAVADQAQADVYKEWLADDRIFLTTWDQETVDIQWEFLELVAAIGGISEVPPKGIFTRILD